MQIIKSTPFIIIVASILVAPNIYSHEPSPQQATQLKNDEVVFLKEGKVAKAWVFYNQNVDRVWNCVKDRTKSVHYVDGLKEASIANRGSDGSGLPWHDVHQVKDTFRFIRTYCAMRYTFDGGAKSVRFNLSPSPHPRQNVQKAVGHIKLKSWSGGTLLEYQIEAQPGAPALQKAAIKKSLGNLRGYLKGT